MTTSALSQSQPPAQSVIVVKCGGHAGVNGAAVCADIADHVTAGHQVVLVHGGSGEIAHLAERLNIPQRRLQSPDQVSTRYTDAATLDVVILALAGAVKPRLVAELQRRGVSAIGLSGLDGGLLQARRKGAVRALVDGRVMIVRDNLSGVIHEVRADLLHSLLALRLVPVISPPAIDETGHPVNVDADRAAAAVAAALGASDLVLLTGAPGLLADPADETSVMPHHALSPSGPPARFASGGMALKLIAAREALTGGVASVRVADGRVTHPLRRALAGAGTAFTLDPIPRTLERLAP